MPQEGNLSALRLQRAKNESLIRILDFEGSPKNVKDNAGSTLVMLNEKRGLRRSVLVAHRLLRLVVWLKRDV